MKSKNPGPINPVSIQGTLAAENLKTLCRVDVYALARGKFLAHRNIRKLNDAYFLDYSSARCILQVNYHFTREQCKMFLCDMRDRHLLAFGRRGLIFTCESHEGAAQAAGHSWLAADAGHNKEMQKS